MTKFIYITLISVVLFIPVFAFAELVVEFPNPLSAENFEELLDVLINWLLVITAPIVVLIIVFAGFQYMMGTFSTTLEKQTSPESIRNAKKMITYALLGYAIILLSKVFLGIITGLFG